MTWTPIKLQQQTEMLPALARVCARCPHVQHMLALVYRGVPLPVAMRLAYGSIRSASEAMALRYEGLRPYVPFDLAEDELTCALLIRASEQLRDAERFYTAWMECQARPVKILSTEDRLRGGDYTLVPIDAPLHMQIPDLLGPPEAGMRRVSR